MEIERIVVRLFADAMPYDRELRRAEMSLTNFAGRMGTLGAMLQLPIRAATVGVFALTAAAAASGYAAVKLAADYETVGISLEVMTGSADKARRLISDINKLAVETPFKSTGLQSAAKELAAFGIETEQLRPTLRALGDVASGVATDNLDEMMGRIVLAFGQVKTAGRLMGPEARQFVQAGVPVYDYLAKVFDKPVEMMKQMTEEGQVGFSDLVKAFNLMTAEGGRFFGMMERQSQTVRGRWSAFVETVELTLRDVGRGAFEGLGIKELLEDLRRGAEDLRGNGGGFVEFFREVKQFVVDAWLNVKGFYATVRQLWIELKGLGNQIGDWYRVHEDQIKRVVQLVAVFGLTVYGVIKAVTLATAAWGLMTAAVAFIMSPLGATALILGAVVAALVAVADKAGAFDNLGKGFAETFSGFGDTFKATWGSIRDAVQSGEMELAGQIAFKGIELAWRMTVAAMHKEWRNFMFNLSLAGQAMKGKNPGEWNWENILMAAGGVVTFDAQQAGTAGRGAGLMATDAYYDMKASLAFISGASDEEMKKIAKDKQAMTEKILKADLEHQKYFAAVNDQRNKDIMEPVHRTQRELEELQKAVNRKIAEKAAAIEKAKADATPGRADIDEFHNQREIEWRQTLGKELIARRDHADVVSEREVEWRGKVGRKIKEFEKLFDLPFDDWTDAIKSSFERWREREKKAFDDVTKKFSEDIETWRAREKAQFDAETLAGSALIGGLSAVQAKDPTIKTQMAPPISYSPGVLALGGDIRREMAKEQDKGIGFGAGQYSAFMKTFGMLQEARHGPAHELRQTMMPAMPFFGIGNAITKGIPGGIIDENQKQFGLFREYQNLRRWVGSGAGERLPPALVEGSSEAQDVINRTQMGSGDKMAEMLATLQAAEALQREQKKIMEEESGKLTEIINRLTGRGY